MHFIVTNLVWVRGPLEVHVLLLVGVELAPALALKMLTRNDRITTQTVVERIDIIVRLWSLQIQHKAPIGVNMEVTPLWEWLKSTINLIEWANIYIQVIHVNYKTRSGVVFVVSLYKKIYGE